MSKYYFVARSAVTGRFVSACYARRYPHLTVRERRSKCLTKLDMAVALAWRHVMKRRHRALRELARR